MKKYGLLLTVLVLAVFRGHHVQAQIIAGPDTTLCLGQSVTLHATLTGGGGYGTENYVFDTIPFSTEAYEGTGVNLMDDDYTNALDIGFDFCFLGETYDQFYIGSNGWISFGPESALAATYVSVPIPDTDPTVPKNCIASPWEDWDPGYFGDTYIYYQTIGTAPDRKLVVSWVDIPMFDCWDDESLNGTFQIVIYETTNIIEDNIEFKENCASWFPTGTQGVHNLDGTLAYTAPGRNGTTWEAYNESTRFVPSGIEWYDGATLIGYSDTLTVTPTETTTYTAVVTLCDGTEYSDNVTVGVSLLEESITINDVLCNGEENGSASIEVTGDNPPFTYDWSTGETDTDIDGAGAGDYTVTVEDASGCVITFDVPITEPDELEADPADIVNALCFGYEDGSVTIETSGGTAPYTYTLNGNDQSSNEYTDLAAGDYTVTVTDANGCVSETSFTITQPDEMFIDAGADVTIPQGASYTITATTATSLSDLSGVSWGPTGGVLGCPEDPCLIYTVTPPYTTTYLVSISDLNGCSASDYITINVQFIPEVYFPNAFSPNGDNVNDLFQAVGYNVVGFTLQIFDRWGEMVYETNSFDYNNGWDGKINGDDANVGSYVYQVSVDFNTGDVFNSSGNFMLVR